MKIISAVFSAILVLAACNRNVITEVDGKDTDLGTQ